MTMPTIETTQEMPSKLRWYQYRLRSLMTLTIFIGLFTAAWTYSRKAERQAVQLKQAEKKIQALEKTLTEIVGHEYGRYFPDWRTLVLKARGLEIGRSEKHVLATLGEPNKKVTGVTSMQSFGGDVKWLPTNTTAWYYEESRDIDIFWIYVFMSGGKVLGVQTGEYIMPEIRLSK